MHFSAQNMSDDRSGFEGFLLWEIQNLPLVVEGRSSMDNLNIWIMMIHDSMCVFLGF